MYIYTSNSQSCPVGLQKGFTPHQNYAMRFGESFFVPTGLVWENGLPSPIHHGFEQNNSLKNGHQNAQKWRGIWNTTDPPGFSIKIYHLLKTTHHWILRNSESSHRSSILRDGKDPVKQRCCPGKPWQNWPKNIQSTVYVNVYVYEACFVTRIHQVKL